MRLAAQAKCGFYPAPPEAVTAALKRIRRTPGERVSILDPCCGRGAALKQIAMALDVDAHGIELDGLRSEIAKETIEDMGGKFVGPSSFFTTMLRPRGCFSMIWLNRHSTTRSGAEAAWSSTSC